jgi:hypothetical protein
MARARDGILTPAASMGPGVGGGGGGGGIKHNDSNVLLLYHLILVILLIELVFKNTTGFWLENLANVRTCFFGF